MVQHLHREFVEGCYRCDLSRDELRDGCPECGERPEYCPGHKPGDPPHIETCRMCADLQALIND